jgi:hypothetical protein
MNPEGDSRWPVKAEKRIGRPTQYRFRHSGTKKNVGRLSLTQS